MQSEFFTTFLSNTPRVTRILILAISFISLLVYLGILHPHQLIYSRYHLPTFQFYRLFTSFLYFGNLSVEVALHILFFFRYSSMLEESCSKTSDYFYLLCIIFLVLSLLSSIYYIPLLGPALSSTITYIWTRRNPQAVVQIMGFISFYAFYLPFLVPMFTLILEGKISIDELIGLLVGHLVFFLKDVYPSLGSDILATPCWCHWLFNELCAKCKKTTGKGVTLRELRKKAAEQALNEAKSKKENEEQVNEQANEENNGQMNEQVIEQNMDTNNREDYLDNLDEVDSEEHSGEDWEEIAIDENYHTINDASDEEQEKEKILYEESDNSWEEIEVEDTAV